MLNQDEKAILRVKYSRMSPGELREEWEFWIASSARWEQIQSLARDKGMPEAVELCSEAIADNGETIELIEWVQQTTPP